MLNQTRICHDMFVVPCCRPAARRRTPLAAAARAEKAMPAAPEEARSERASCTAALRACRPSMQFNPKKARLLQRVCAVLQCSPKSKSCLEHVLYAGLLLYFHASSFRCIVPGPVCCDTAMAMPVSRSQTLYAGGVCCLFHAPWIVNAHLCVRTSSAALV